VEVKELLDLKNGYRLIDVREEWEYDICHIYGCELMPLSRFQEFLPDLKKNDKLIIYCHHGVRSLRTAHELARNGYRNVINMTKGIEGWSDEVDESVQKY